MFHIPILTWEDKYSSIVIAISSPARSLLLSSFQILSTIPCCLPLKCVLLLWPNIALPKITKGILVLLIKGAGDQALDLCVALSSFWASGMLCKSGCYLRCLLAVKPEFNSPYVFVRTFFFSSFPPSVSLGITVLYLAIFLATVH